ncbi:hypothetical protein HMPREF0491_03049 [Lachnospiraceae oral taxon 107 str. F0167]|nr:hypothetical protein HMPREF0491_03049 [Lachnospiraceae oral taxon 107 str. F0167]
MKKMDKKDEIMLVNHESLVKRFILLGAESYA